MNSTRGDKSNLETKYFDDNKYKENTPINHVPVTSRTQNNFLQTLTQITNAHRKFDGKKKNYYVSKFIQCILPENQKLKKLNEIQLQIINDQASAQKPQQKKLTLYNNVQKKLIQSFTETLNRNLDRIPLIIPGSFFKKIWDVCAILARIYFVFVIPLDLGWREVSFLFFEFQGVSILFLIIIMIDLLLGVNTAYYKDGQLVTNRINILKYSFFNTYGLQWFSVLLMLVFFFISISKDTIFSMKSSYSYQLLILFLVHFKPIINTVNYYEQHLNLNKKSQSSLELCKLLFVLFYSIHIFSCLWMLIGTYSVYTYHKSWLIQSEVETSDWDIQYLQSVYYSAVTMFTIGYGDVTPQSSTEKIFAVIYIIAASIQLPYSVNTLGAIIQQISAYTEEKKRKLSLLNSYLNQQNVPQSLQIQIKEYLTYLWENQYDSKNEEVNEIIDQLSSDLKDQLIIESYQQILNKCTLFKIGFSNNFRVNLVKLAKEFILSPEEPLQLEDNEGVNIYYILQGQLKMNHYNGQNLGTLISGQSIGLVNFIKEAKDQEQYKSVGFSKLLKIEKKKFLKLIQEYPDDYEKYCQIRDRLSFQSTGSLLFSQKCLSCENDNHILSTCPLIHYIPDKEKIIKQYTYPHKQLRVPFKRGQKMVNFLSKRQVLNDLKRSSLQLQKDNPDILKLYIAEYIVEHNKTDLSQSLAEISTMQQSLSLERQQDPRSNKLIEQVRSQRKKFKTIVNKVISLNQEYQHTKLFEVDGTLQKQNIMYSIIEQRHKVLENLNNKCYKKDIDQISHLIQTNRQTDTNLDQFDNAANFKYYYPKNNFNNLKFLEQNEKIKKTKKLSKKFLLYFLYPFQIIQQYGLQTYDISKKLSKKRQNLYVAQEQLNNW